MSWYNVREFNWTKGEYTGRYYKLTDFDFFVNSETGDDTNAGTYDAPFKTISRVKALGSSYWYDGVKIAIWGEFTESVALNVGVALIGCGGHRGRTIINKTGTAYLTITVSSTNTRLENIHFTNYENAVLETTSIILKSVNCIFDKVNRLTYNTGNNHYSYYSTFIECKMSTSAGEHYLYGNNNTLIDCTTQYRIAIYGNNNYVNNNVSTSGTSTGNLKNADARYFTDNTEAIPADLLIDVDNGNYNFKKTVNIWDKTNAEYITVNPLWESGSYNSNKKVNENMGSGYESYESTGLDSALIDTGSGGTATYDNIGVDANGLLYRIDDTVDGTITTGRMYLDEAVKGVAIDIPHTFTTFDGEFIKKLQYSASGFGMDVYARWGIDDTECDAADWLLIEIGKVISYSESGGTKYGNADASFNPSSAIVPTVGCVDLVIKYKTV